MFGATSSNACSNTVVDWLYHGVNNHILTRARTHATPQINFEKDIGEAVFMPLLEQSALASIGNSFGKAGVLVEGQVIGEDSRGQ